MAKLNIGYFLEEYAEKMVKEWCAKHGLEYNKTDDKSAQELINVAVKRFRAEGITREKSL